MGRLRSRIKCSLTEENGERPNLLEFIDRWATDDNTFLDDKVPTGNRTALLSASGTTLLRLCFQFYQANRPNVGTLFDGKRGSTS